MYIYLNKQKVYWKHSKELKGYTYSWTKLVNSPPVLHEIKENDRIKQAMAEYIIITGILPH